MFLFSIVAACEANVFIIVRWCGTTRWWWNLASSRVVTAPCRVTYLLRFHGQCTHYTTLPSL